MSLALLYLAALAPAGQVGLCAAAGVIPAAPLSRRRVSLGMSVYAASALLAWIVLPRKSVAFAYTAIFGAYTLLKYAIEKLRYKPLQWVCKLSYATLVLALCALVVWAFAAPALRLPASPGRIAALGGAVLAYYALFLVYELAFSRLTLLLRQIFPP